MGWEWRRCQIDDGGASLVGRWDGCCRSRARRLMRSRMSGNFVSNSVALMVQGTRERRHRGWPRDRGSLRARRQHSTVRHGAAGQRANDRRGEWCASLGGPVRRRPVKPRFAMQSPPECGGRQASVCRTGKNAGPCASGRITPTPWITSCGLWLFGTPPARETVMPKSGAYWKLLCGSIHKASMPNLLAQVDIAETADFLGDDRSAQLRRAEAAIDRTIAVASMGYLIQNQSRPSP